MDFITQVFKMLDSVPILIEKTIDALPLASAERRLLKTALATISDQGMAIISRVDLLDYVVALETLSPVEIPTELKQALSKPKIKIPQEEIQNEVSKLLEVVENATLTDFSCRASGITTILTLKKYGAVISYLLQTRIRRIHINSAKQQLELEVLAEETKGQNLMGQIACMMMPTLISDSTNKMISQTGLSKHIERVNHNSMKVELSSMDVIKSLKTPLPGSSKSWLDLLSITDASHIEGGILLTAKVAI